MNFEKLTLSIAEAQRFITKAKIARNAIANDRMVLLTGSKETGAAIRASMDLTRMLADLRRPNYE